MSALPVRDKSARRRARVSTVLVAEDHDDTRFLLRTLLERRGLAVVEACDGEEAFRAAEREHPDLILMDGGLPLLDGVSVTRRLRGTALFSRIPIVFLSGHAGHQYQSAARAAGCDEYVVKPFDLARLDNVLNRLLPARQGQKTMKLDQTRMTQSVTTGSRARREGPSMSPERSPTQKIYGLIELDEAGTVLYTRFEGEAAASFTALNSTGRNFYDEVAPFSNVGEFRQQLNAFNRGSQATHSMDFTCHYEDGPLPVRILLTRIRQRTERDVTTSVLVHIRRAK